jgi:hypothetical protein
LEGQGVIRRTWVGRRCRGDDSGNLYAGGDLVNRASEFEFIGFKAGE